MEIEKIQVVNASHIWGPETKKLIQMRLNIGDLKLKSTNEIEGFSHRIKTLIPSLYSRKCQQGVTGGFFRTLDNGITIPEVVAHIAAELQTLAGTETDFSTAVISENDEVYNIIVSYIHEDAGMFAAMVAVEIVEALLKDTPYFIRYDIERLKEINKESRLASITSKNKQQYFRLNHHETVNVGYVINHHSKQINQSLQQAR